MATYNFTVRATDNLGAYADQNFSLTVNNTNIERWVVVGSTGLAHSSDGATWTVEAGQSGGRVAFGNGKWVVYAGSQDHTSGLSGTNGVGLQIRTSTDAFNWTTVTPNFPLGTFASTVSGSNANYTPNIIQSLRYQNGLWTAIVSTTNIAPNASIYYAFLCEFNSPDLVTWNYVGRTSVSSSSSGNCGVVFDHYMDPAGNVVMLYYPSAAPGIATRVAANSSFTQTLTGMGSFINEGWIAYTNGLWCVSGGSTGTPNTGANVWTSIDAQGWTARSVNATANAATYGIAYANGRLITRNAQVNGTTSVPSYSLNGGRTWVALPTITLGGGSVGGNAGYQSSAQGSAYYGGKFISIEGQSSTTTYLLTSTDSGQTFTTGSTQIGTGIGVAQAIGVRNN